jgi:hypothetical protein
MTTGLNSEASTLYSAVNGCRGTHLPRYSHARAQATDTEPRARRGKNERLETKKQRRVNACPVDSWLLR